jgi:transcription antitermination factor NusG
VKERLPILITPGIVSIIGFGNEPTPIDEAEIEAVRLLSELGFVTEPCLYLREGQRIRINSGPLKGLEGILLKKKSDWRMLVSITLLQRSVSAQIDSEWVTSA